MKYRMLTNGGTRGAVTGHNRVWRPGQIVEAPKGEFAHVPDHVVVVDDDTPETATAKPKAEAATTSKPRKRTKKG